MKLNYTFDHDGHPITEVWRPIIHDFHPSTAYSRIPGHFHEQQIIRIIDGLNEQARKVRYVTN